VLGRVHVAEAMRVVHPIVEFHLAWPRTSAAYRPNSSAP